MLFAANLVLSHRIVEEWHGLVNDVLEYDVELAQVESLLLEVCKVQHEIKGRGHVHAEVVQCEDVSLEI